MSQGTRPTQRKKTIAVYCLLLQNYQINGLSRIQTKSLKLAIVYGAYLDGIHIMCNGDKGGLFLLDEVGHMIYTVLQCDWLLLGGCVATFRLLLS